MEIKQRSFFGPLWLQIKAIWTLIPPLYKDSTQKFVVRQWKFVKTTLRAMNITVKPKSKRWQLKESQMKSVQLHGISMKTNEHQYKSMENVYDQSSAHFGTACNFGRVPTNQRIKMRIHWTTMEIIKTKANKKTNEPQHDTSESQCIPTGFQWDVKKVAI